MRCRCSITKETWKVFTYVKIWQIMFLSFHKGTATLENILGKKGKESTKWPFSNKYLKWPWSEDDKIPQASRPTTHIVTDTRVEKTMQTCWMANKESSTSSHRLITVEKQPYLLLPTTSNVKVIIIIILRLMRQGS